MIQRTLIGVIAIAAVAATYFWNDIQNIRALLAYEKLFETESLDENFRSMYLLAPTVSIETSGPSAPFDVALTENVFPETYRINSVEKAFGQLWDAVDVSGIVILRDGKLVYEDYYRGNSEETLHILFSVTKSLTSIVFGAVVDNGDIKSLQDKVTDYLPELVGSGYDGVTLQQVLDMTSGIRYVEDYDDLESDIVRTVVASLRGSVDEHVKTIVSQREPGSYNQYASIETQVLSMVLRRATGRSYVDLFNEYLWSKIGAEARVELLTDSVGEPLAYGGANVRLRDLARVGQMLLNGGISMTGERVVSERWISDSITPNTPQSRPGYDNPNSDYPLGYKNQWWIPTNRAGGEYTAIGIYGQFLYVNPEAGVVIAVNSAYADYNNENNLELDTVAGLQAIAQHISAPSE